MTKKSNIFRVLTFVVVILIITLLVYKWISAIGCGTDEPGFWFLLTIFSTIFGLGFPSSFNYETKIYKPEKVQYHLFDSHIALVVDGRSFSFTEKGAIYNMLRSGQNISRLMCKQHYNLYWCKTENYTLIIGDLISEDDQKAKTKPKAKS